MIGSQEIRRSVNMAVRLRSGVFVSEIINLRQARKRVARAVREETAAANRAKHGQTKAQRILKQAEADRLRKTLDGAKREEPHQ